MASQKTTLQKGQFERLVNKAKRLEKQIASCVQSHQKLAAQIEKNRPCVVECKKKNVQKAEVPTHDRLKKNKVPKAAVSRPRSRLSLAQQVDRIKREGQRKKREQKRQINRQARKQ